MIKFLTYFTLNSRGAVMPIIAVALLLLVGTTGAAIDMERNQQVQAKLSSSLDAAGLAAGSTLSTINVEAEVTKYLNANFRNYLDAEISEITTAISPDNAVITITATATVPSTLMRVLGITGTDVQAVTEVTRTSTGLELAMVLDNTGSMSGSKLSSLKNAATDLVNILYGDKTEIDDLFIGLVPFSQSVNIGTDHASWTTADSLNWGPTSWGGCVEARYGDNRDITDDPPTTSKFDKYYWQCNSSYNGWYGSNYYRTNCAINRYSRYRWDIGNNRGPNKYCAQPITRLTDKKQTILNAIGQMNAAGNTHINLGAAWGWRLLSPRWRGLWGGDMDTLNLPLDYNTPEMNKAAIIMTDGDNTMSNGIYSSYGLLSEGNLGTTSSSNARLELNSRLAQVCTAMKNNNILVYTISFGNISSTSRTMMETCASQPEYYFNSPTNADLQTAFRAIGDSLATLRVSK